jgi:acyl transferase domain-containing protein
MNTNDDKEKTGLEIAVIGMDGRFPGVGHLHESWDNLKNGAEAYPKRNNIKKRRGLRR